MTRREPVIRLYTNEECTELLSRDSDLPPGEAGNTVIWDVFIRNEGALALESWSATVQGWYQVLKDEEDPAKGYDLKETMDVALVSTPRPHRLEPGEKAHLRVRWSPPIDNYDPLIWKIAAGGPYIISPFD